jgi:8-amino-7-oxononanoate synthase
MFSHDGSAAPLKEYRRALPESAWLLVDDAHGAGILGRTGRGTPEHERIARDRLIQTITFSKAFGTFGGAILGDRALRAKILNKSSLFAGSTPLPLPLVNAAYRALALCGRSSNRLFALRRNAEFVKAGLREAGFAVPNHPGPVVALCPRTSSAARQLERGLFRCGTLPPLIRYPGGPATGFFRFSISSQHQPAELEQLLQAILSCAKPADFSCFP